MNLKARKIRLALMKRDRFNPPFELELSEIVKKWDLHRASELKFRPAKEPNIRYVNPGDSDFNGSLNSFLLDDELAMTTPRNRKKIIATHYPVRSIKIIRENGEVTWVEI